jgi:WD40 repeat protein
VGEIMGTSKPINSVDFKPTRPFRAVVASEDSNICYFEGPPFKWNKTLSEHTRFVNVIRYSPNGEKFASGGADGKVRFIFIQPTHLLFSKIHVILSLLSLTVKRARNWAKSVHIVEVF